MSQIAELYLVPEPSIPGIRAAAVPRKTASSGKVEDTFWQTLRTHAGPGRLEFEWSGYAFVVLLEYLRDGEHFDVQTSEQEELAAFLSQARQSYFLTFTPAQAEEFARKLESLPMAEAEVAQYVIEFCGEEDHETMTAAVQAAARILPRVLREVKAGTIGLMTAG